MVVSLNQTKLTTNVDNVSRQILFRAIRGLLASKYVKA